ncbi:MAG: hypothetical protein AB9897_06500 [Anaerolineaceae bacterium]
MDRSEKILLICFGGLIIFGLCIALACGGTLAMTGLGSVIKDQWSTLSPTPSTIEPPEVIPIPTDTQGSTQFSEPPETTLERLKQTNIPEADWIQLAKEFYGITNVPLSLTTPPVAYKNGDTLPFWVLDVDTNENTKITATLQYQTKNIYFWVENGVDFNRQTLKKVVDTFANKIYPTDQEFFGKEWIPGVDNDPHLYILYTRGMGGNVAGYTSFTDTYLTQIQEYSNEHEMFYVSADDQDLSDPYVLSVMSHEFQHLIHGYHDKNEELWLNEGFSELSVFLSGYDTGGFDQLFASEPDINLTEWPNDSNNTSIHYGSSFLFTLYMLDRFGEKTTKAVVADSINGLNSLDDVFTTEDLVDPLTNVQVSGDDLFQDWTITNYFNDPTLADGRYTYHNYSRVPNFTNATSFENCANGSQQARISQYGADYIQYNCSNPVSLTFNGSPTVGILSENPSEGSHYVWSNMTDASATRMTREFDLTNLTGPINLTYDIWYDIEQDYDYAYLLASTDGVNWKILDTPSCVTSNPTGNNFGCGYNGVSGGWLREDIDLSQYAGEKVNLRFEYITDEGVTGEGFVIDSLAIPQLDYKTGFETDDGGWLLEGITRIENQIPQTFLVSVIRGTGEQTVIEKYVVNNGQPLTIAFDPANEGGQLTLVVSGSSRYSRQKASYQIDISN